MPTLPKIYLLFTLCVLCFSCKKDVDEGPGFDMIIQKDFEIPAGISPFQVHHFILSDVPTNYLDLLKEAGKVDSEITGIRNTTGDLSAAFGDARLDFIQRISIKAFPSDDENDLLEVSYRDPAPNDSGNLLGLIPSLADAKSHLGQARINFDVIIHTRYTTQESVPVRLDLRFRAKFSE